VHSPLCPPSRGLAFRAPVEGSGAAGSPIDISQLPANWEACQGPDVIIYFCGKPPAAMRRGLMKSASKSNGAPVGLPDRSAAATARRARRQ